MTIYLGCLLPNSSCGLPETAVLSGRRTSHPCLFSLLLFDLAPDRGYLAGTLLHLSVVSYTTFAPLPVARRYISVALSVGLPRPGNSPVSCSLECGLSSPCQRQVAIIQPVWAKSSYLCYLLASNYSFRSKSFGKIHY
jgi:hypothetical protein